MTKLLAAFILVVAPCLLHAAAPTTPPTADASSVILWHFDEGQGDQATDASGGNHTGKITGATWVDGKFGQALRWGEDNGQVNTPAPFPQVTNQLTLQCWVKLDKLPTGKIPFWTADTIGYLAGAMISIRPLNATTGILYVGVQLGSQPNNLMCQTPIPVGEWTHIALVYDGPAKKLGAFVNGKLDSEFDVPPGAPMNVNASTSPFWARSYGGNDEKLVGAIDEVSLSNRAETFGYKWHSNLYVHLLRYPPAFLVGAGTMPPQPDNPVTAYQLEARDSAGKVVVDSGRIMPQRLAEGVVAPARDLRTGDYTASVYALHRQGPRELVVERKFHFTRPAGKIGITADNVTLLDGKPFFPLGAYHVRPADLQTVRDGGFNLAFSWTTTLLPTATPPGDGVGYVEKCGAAGLKSVGLGGITKEIFAHYRDNPDLLMWYVADEPGGPGEGPDDLQRSYETCAESDPTHPQFLLQNKPGEFFRYASACDIYATDPYPINRQAQASLENVASWTQGAVAAVFDRKPVYVALQCYTTKAVSEAGKPLDGAPRLPTAAEMRCMSYTALAAGARGLLYYAFDDSYYNNGAIRGVNLAKEYPEFWGQLSAIVKELGARQQLWTAPYSTLRPESLGPDLIVQHKPYLAGGKTYLLVVNPKYDARPVKVRLPGVKTSGAVQDALGGTPGKITNGELTDTLEGLQAKCYVW
jgi:hypothetical protein